MFFSPRTSMNIKSIHDVLLRSCVLRLKGRTGEIQWPQRATLGTVAMTFHHGRSDEGVGTKLQKGSNHTKICVHIYIYIYNIYIYIYIYIYTRRYLKKSTSKQKPVVLARFFIGCIAVPTKTINNQRIINVVI